MTTTQQVMTDCSQVDLIKSGGLTFGQGTPSVFYSHLAIATTIRALAGEPVPEEVVIPGNIYTRDNIDDAPLWIEGSPKFLGDCSNSSGSDSFEEVPYDEYEKLASNGFEG